MTKSVALYARVSSERQAQQSTIDSQLVAVRERAVQDGFVVLPSDEYVDNGYSGSTLRRPALERLRDRIAEGSVDVVYVHNPDRLARRHAHQVLLLEEFSARGVRVVMLQGRNGESPEDQLLTQVQGVIAEYERTKIMERSRRGKTRRGATARAAEERTLGRLGGIGDSPGVGQSELRRRSGIWKDGARRVSAAASDHRSLRHSPPRQERLSRARTRALDPDRRAADRVG